MYAYLLTFAVTELFIRPPDLCKVDPTPLMHCYSTLRPAPLAGQLLISGLLLLYTALICPVQICMWNYDDPCNTFPTLRFDIFVDCFFMVRPDGGGEGREMFLLSRFHWREG